jgi:predicted transcriptional regulator
MGEANPANGGANPLACPPRQRYTESMTSKDMAIKTIQDLPDSATWEEIEERVRFLAAIDKGLADIKAGRVVPHEEVKESLSKWLSK